MQGGKICAPAGCRGQVLIYFVLWYTIAQIYFLMENLGGFTPAPRWFRQWWGVLLLTIVGAVICITAALAGLTGYYWWRISHGGGAQLAQELSGSFTLATAKNGPVRGAIDRASLESATAPSRGVAGAPLTIVEFVDFKCPNCRASQPILQRLIQQYGQKVHLIIRDFPVETLHPGATELAQVAWCAGKQGRYWQVHDWLYAHQDGVVLPLSSADIDGLALDTGMDRTKLDACRTSAEASQKVKADYFAAIGFGVRGTPTFFLNGTKVEGVIPWDAWEKVLLPGTK